jgi:pimeloyl-ACP methyl ester carboxylesterase
MTIHRTCRAWGFLKYLALVTILARAGFIAHSQAADFTNNVDMGGRTLEFASFGQGSPAVIVEAGMGEPPVESGTWKTVIEEISKTTRICIYDRAGLGKSGPVTNASRTAQDVANDLHALLVAAKIPPPYILVGHSIGGFVVRLYATQHPNDVAGIVLVDSSHPDQWAKWVAALPPESADEGESIQKARKFLTQVVQPANNPERLDITASGNQVRASGNFGDKPLVVLSHSPSKRIAPDLPDALAQKIEDAAAQLQIDLCRLSSKSTHKIADKAGHYIQAEEPKLVIDAILETLKDARTTTK